MFKEDLPIFVALEEFAELVDVDGVKLPAQLMTMNKERSERMREQFPRLEGDFAELFFRAEDYIAIKKRLPRVHEWTFINGRRFDVISSEDDLGMAHLILASYRQPALR